MKKTLTRPVDRLANVYEKDETAWLDRSVELIKEGRYDELDYTNLIDFLESMANRDRKEVKSRLVTLIAHLLKWQYQPKRRTQSWRRTIISQHNDLGFDLAESKTLRNHAADVLDEIYARAVKSAAAETKLPADTFPKHCPYTVDFLVSDEIFKIVAEE